MIVWLSAEQVAERLSISKRSALAIMYQMPHTIIGGTTRKRIRVTEGSFEAWMAKKSNRLPVINEITTGSRKKLKRR